LIEASWTKARRSQTSQFIWSADRTIDFELCDGLLLLLDAGETDLENTGEKIWEKEGQGCRATSIGINHF
jgi:hypothetical protein